MKWRKAQIGREQALPVPSNTLLEQAVPVPYNKTRPQGVMCHLWTPVKSHSTAVLAASV